MMNYAKLIDDEGNVLGVLATEPGTVNEVTLVEIAMEQGLNLVKATKDEYDSFEGEEIKPDWME